MPGSPHRGRWHGRHRQRWPPGAIHRWPRSAAGQQSAAWPQWSLFLPQSKVSLTPGTRFTLITDGVVEAQSKGDELFGFDRAAAMSTKTAEEIARAAQAFGQEDDITVLTLTRPPVADPAAAQLQVQALSPPACLKILGVITLARRFLTVADRNDDHFGYRSIRLCCRNTSRRLSGNSSARSRLPLHMALPRRKLLPVRDFPVIDQKNLFRPSSGIERRRVDHRRAFEPRP